jgi:putative Mn2+ efflux pump MntP
MSQAIQLESAIFKMEIGKISLTNFKYFLAKQPNISSNSILIMIGWWIIAGFCTKSGMGNRNNNLHL